MDIVSDIDFLRLEILSRIPSTVAISLIFCFAVLRYDFKVEAPGRVCYALTLALSMIPLKDRITRSIAFRTTDLIF